MAVALAYEQGFLSKEGLTRTQQWALSYYLVMQRRRENEHLKAVGDLRGEVHKLSFITNPKLYDVVNKTEPTNSEEESLPVSASELGDFDKMLEELDNIQTRTFSNLGEWV